MFANYPIRTNPFGHRGRCPVTRRATEFFAHTIVLARTVVVAARTLVVVVVGERVVVVVVVDVEARTVSVSVVRKVRSPSSSSICSVNTVEDNVDCGVPEMTPVDVFNVKPLGRAGVMEKLYSLVIPMSVNEEVERL